MRQAIVVIALLAAAACAAQDQPYGIPNRRTVDVRIDGRVSASEYPAHFVDAATGIGVSWVSDGKLLYVALENPGPGWVAVAFGNSKIRGTAMFIGYHDGAGGRVDEHFGFFFSNHMPVQKPALLDFATGGTQHGSIIEFSIPLKLTNGQTITPGVPMPFVVALNSRKQGSFRGRPTKKAPGMLLLAKPEGDKTRDLKFDDLDSLK